MRAYQNAPGELPFADFYRQQAPTVFALARATRERQFHWREESDEAGRTCWDLSKACHECSEFNDDLMLDLWSTVRPLLTEPDFALGPYVRAAGGRAEGLLQKQAGDQGMVHKPGRMLRESAWVHRLVPDERDARILGLMLRFVRSNDPTEEAGYPVSRFAEKLDLPDDYVHEAVRRIPEQLAESKGVEWVEANLRGPLERMLQRTMRPSLDAPAGTGADGDHRTLGDRLADPEVDAEDQVLRAIDDAAEVEEWLGDEGGEARPNPAA